jgi:hypothetical protein
MAQRGIVPQHQTLNNQALFAYKTKIELTKMAYKLVPPQQPSLQPCQEGHQNVQGAHGQRTQQMLAHNANASLVPASPPDQTPIASPSSVEGQSQHPGLRTRVRPS